MNDASYMYTHIEKFNEASSHIQPIASKYTIEIATWLKWLVCWP